ncbi:hypothetical protein M422DRAFT_260103, partial [Sphaerobolus stellatus SS14]
EIVAKNKHSKLIYVLNKIDLVPRETLSVWLKELRTQHPTFLFRAASTFLPKQPLMDPKAKGKAKESVEDAIGSKALLEYLGQRAQAKKGDEALQVAVVGLTNSGKSAIVNSLASKQVVPIYIMTAATEAWSTTTTRAHEVEVEVSSHKINIVDTPGVSLKNEQEYDADVKIQDMLLRSRGRVDKVKDPVPPVEKIVARANTQDLMVQYNLPAFTKGDTTAFLNGIARAANMLKKGGEPDHLFAGRAVLRDWTTAKLPYYTDAPAVSAEARVVDEKDLKDLYAKADEKALKEVRSKKEMRKEGGLVLLERGSADTRKVVLDKPFVVEGESDDEDEADFARYIYDGGEDEEDEEDEEEEEEEDVEEDEDENEEDEGEDEEEEEEEEAPTSKSKSNKRKASKASAPPPKKKVAFAAGIQDAPERKLARNVKSKSRSAPIPGKVPPKPKAKTPGPVKPSNKPKARKEANAGGNDDSYDFNQFF